MEKIKISKLDAARRQLITAIRLYFNHGDIVSVHTLSAAAFKTTQDIGGQPFHVTTRKDII